MNILQLLLARIPIQGLTDSGTNFFEITEPEQWYSGPAIK